MNYKSRNTSLPHGRCSYVIGVDEAGRGPIAGPVTVAAVAFLQQSGDTSFFNGANEGRPTSFIGERLKGVKDSKQLTEKRREYWRNTIEHLVEKGVLKYAVHSTEASIIDSRGIVFAIERSLHAALAALALPPQQCFVTLDGLLKAPDFYPHQETIIKGDETELPITLAGIVAKTTRDEAMRQYGEQHPEYGFERHKGYGTEDHFRAIARHGLCRLHRTTFIQTSAQHYGIAL